MPRLCDTHAHLSSDAFDGDREEVVTSALAGGGLGFILDVGTDLASSRRAVGLAQAYEGVHAAIGVHPHDASGYDGPALDEVLALAAEPGVVALGEMGLDYHYDFSPRPAQRRVFQRQLEASRRGGPPVVLHVREAVEETFGVLRDVFGDDPVRGVWHCFSEGWSVARRVLDRGLYIGLTGLVTFPRSEALHEVARRAPLDRLLLETDCPYLSPVPVRKIRRNRPDFVAYVAASVARLRGIALDTLAEATAASASALFGVKVL